MRQCGLGPGEAYSWILTARSAFPLLASLREAQGCRPGQRYPLRGIWLEFYRLHTINQAVWWISFLRMWSSVFNTDRLSKLVMLKWSICTEYFPPFFLRSNYFPLVIPAVWAFFSFLFLFSLHKNLGAPKWLKLLSHWPTVQNAAPQKNLTTIVLTQVNLYLRKGI